ncbi:hypothetical protein Q8791_30865 [Nocardiopsis sp. CT-R113]|uniref:Carrier domain-containing protein n=1 Tax=Nocardiopsis codii TaxID=3065942 RepID=A0ABU7KHY5_9ACTN|nr:hypothetical protein [Nocardiopsis sp. CT-R113]MEE2041632.1 hypothetical protein [Nocardiopsis sp. CT-R113]
MAAVDQSEILAQIKVQAMTVLMFTSNEPQFDLPEPSQMSDLDSFSIVQLVLALEDVYNVSILEDMSEFSGESFEDLTQFIAERIQEQAVAPKQV